MSYWGKIIGGITGFAMGGPVGALVGAAFGHAADTGQVPRMQFGFGSLPGFGGGFGHPARMAALLGGRDQVFALGSVSLSAKLARCDGPVRRSEIEAFKRCFRIPAEHVPVVGQLFDRARDGADGFETYADEMGTAFADNRGMLEEVLAALFAIAGADGPVNGAETAFLRRVWQGFGLDLRGWERARTGMAGGAGMGARRVGEDPYAVLGIGREASGSALHARWKQLMRENHPDTLAARGVPPAFVAAASEKVAKINAAWDEIKRARGL